DIVNNISLAVSTRVIDGVTRGVITAIAATPIPLHEDLIVYIAGIAGTELPPDNQRPGRPIVQLLVRPSAPTNMDEFEISPELMDRSGLRSAMRSFNGDAFGTIFSDNV